MQKIVLILITAFFLTGCSALKKSAGNMVRDKYVSDAEIINSVLANNISEKNFNITKASVSAKIDNVTTKLIASIKHKTPDSVLVVIRSSIGTEVARMLMTGDTLIINDRINKDLIIGKPGIRTLKYGISPDILFVILGDLVLNPVDRNKKATCINGLIMQTSEVNGKVIDYTIDCRKQKTSVANVEENIFTEGIGIRFNKFENWSGLVIPHKIEIKEPDSNIEINIEVEKVDAMWNGNIDFVPGRNYQIKRLR